jgi:hypothetical protein
VKILNQDNIVENNLVQLTMNVLHNLASKVYVLLVITVKTT